MTGVSNGVMWAVQMILSLLREKVERKPLGVEELAAAAAVASSTEPLTKACMPSFAFAPPYDDVLRSMHLAHSQILSHQQ